MKNKLSSPCKLNSSYLPHLSTSLASKLSPKKSFSKKHSHTTAPEKPQLANYKKATHIQLNEKMLIKVCHFLFRSHFLHCFT